MIRRRKHPPSPMMFDSDEDYYLAREAYLQQDENDDPYNDKLTKHDDDVERTHKAHGL